MLALSASESSSCVHCLCQYRSSWFEYDGDTTVVDSTEPDEAVMNLSTFRKRMQASNVQWAMQVKIREGRNKNRGVHVGIVKRRRSVVDILLQIGFGEI